MRPLISVVIPAFNHAEHLPAAIDSALAQTAPVEVIVVDDGSTDHTRRVMSDYGDRIRSLYLPHGGVCAARNAALDVATGDFLQLLDADDTLAPNKVERQLALLEQHPEAGWCTCDVEIHDGAQHTTASARYAYGERPPAGWLLPRLQAGNCIPIMAPLTRRSVVSDLIRFHVELVPEDWHFWCAVAAVAPAVYLPEVLATYTRRRTGMASTHFSARRTVWPRAAPPLRLNLGCGVQGTESWHPLPGFVNLDKSLGWSFEDGLGEFADSTVHGISISHACMYLPERHWPRVFSEIARVLVPGGVVRITEDDTADPRSARRGGWRGSDPFVTLTSPEIVRYYLERFGLTVRANLGLTESVAPHLALAQAWHGRPPDVFFMEGVKPVIALFSPHNDDEALFCSFSILRYRPHVVICYLSTRDYGDPEIRAQETREAMTVLGGSPVEQWQGGDLESQMLAFDQQHHPERVFAPHLHASHPDHVAVAQAARAVFGNRVTTFHTYDATGKVRSLHRVSYEPEWVEAKLRALLRYKTQLGHARAYQFFAADLEEYYGD